MLTFAYNSSDPIPLAGCSHEKFRHFGAYQRTNCFFLLQSFIAARLISFFGVVRVTASVRHDVVSEAEYISCFAVWQTVADDWDHKLTLFAKTLDIWIGCQKNWLYLEQIFNTADIQRFVRTWTNHRWAKQISIWAVGKSRSHSSIRLANVVFWRELFNNRMMLPRALSLLLQTAVCIISPSLHLPYWDDYKIVCKKVRKMKQRFNCCQPASWLTFSLLRLSRSLYFLGLLVILKKNSVCGVHWHNQLQKLSCTLRHNKFFFIRSQLEDLSACRSTRLCQVPVMSVLVRVGNVSREWLSYRAKAVDQSTNEHLCQTTE